MDDFLDSSTIDAFLRVNNSDKEPLDVHGLRVVIAQNRAVLLAMQRDMAMNLGIGEGDYPSIDAINMAMQVAFHLDREFTTRAQKERTEC